MSAVIKLGLLRIFLRTIKFNKLIREQKLN